MLTMKQWKGVAMLATDAVTHGSRAIEKVHLATADRTFTVLELIPPIAPVAAVVHVAHDAITSLSHASVRGAAHLVGGSITGALGWLEEDPGEARKPHPPATIPTT